MNVNYFQNYDHESRLLGFQFLADMVNRLTFCLMTVAEFVAFSVTVFGTMTKSSDRLEVLRQLEGDADPLSNQCWSPTVLENYP